MFPFLRPINDSLVVNVGDITISQNLHETNFYMEKQLLAKDPGTKNGGTVPYKAVLTIGSLGFKVN